MKFECKSPFVENMCMDGSFYSVVMLPGYDKSKLKVKFTSLPGVCKYKVSIATSEHTNQFYNLFGHSSFCQSGENNTKAEFKEVIEIFVSGDEENTNPIKAQVEVVGESLVIKYNQHPIEHSEMLFDGTEDSDEVECSKGCDAQSLNDLLNEVLSKRSTGKHREDDEVDRSPFKWDCTEKYWLNGEEVDKKTFESKSSFSKDFWKNFDKSFEDFDKLFRK